MIKLLGRQLELFIDQPKKESNNIIKQLEENIKWLRSGKLAPNQVRKANELNHLLRRNG